MYTTDGTALMLFPQNSLRSASQMQDQPPPGGGMQNRS